MPQKSDATVRVVACLECVIEMLDMEREADDVQITAVIPSLGVLQDGWKGILVKEGTAMTFLCPEHARKRAVANLASRPMVYQLLGEEGPACPG